jgi:hypothetical protein
MLKAMREQFYISVFTGFFPIRISTYLSYLSFIGLITIFYVFDLLSKPYVSMEGPFLVKVFLLSEAYKLLLTRAILVGVIDVYLGSAENISSFF